MAGIFIGSASSRFRYQAQGDIYFEDQLQVNPQLRRRIVHGCVAWGLSIVFVERKELGNENWVHWQGGLEEIFAHDMGHAGETPDGIVETLAALLPQANDGVYEFNNFAVPGLEVPWDHKVIVGRLDGGPLHYHQPKRRRNHSPRIPSIMIHGKHYMGRAVEYGSQLQNYRRILTM
ncbi:hypothetical protein K488DRAFT_88359 [Vararia minispora EC-137]|uniref:Uncharacterized protein n=1 Tax=Vararia minispora EC-137 TaxID=1314806 RepID=A0ACB8QE21_9AGAM|nr:hypothetical protein K488DRAFT_88359 [Vararia minispora EC-137]